MRLTNVSHYMPDFEQGFVRDVVRVLGSQPIDYVVLNAGILKYPNASTKLQLPPHSLINAREPRSCKAISSFSLRVG